MMSQKFVVFGLVALVGLSSFRSTSALPLAKDLGLLTKGLETGLLGEIIDIGEVVESGLEELEGSASGLPDGSLLLELIQTLLNLLKKELGELEGSGSGLGSLEGSHGLGSLEHGKGSHGSNEQGNNGKRTHGHGSKGKGHDNGNGEDQDAQGQNQQ